MSNEKEDFDEIIKLRKEIEELKRSLKELKTSLKEDAPKNEKVDDLQKETESTEEPEETAPEGSSSWEEPKRRWHDYDRYYYGHNFGDRLGEYIGGFVEDIMEGVNAELERSLFVGPHTRRHRTRRKMPIDAKETASVMSALGNEHRIRILEELSYGGLYASGFQEALSEISASTLSSHLDVLEEAGLIFQEKKRGRYLITFPGRLAVKMAYQVARRSGAKSTQS